MSLLKRTVIAQAFAAAMLFASAPLAQAEMVLHIGNGAEPGTLDPQKSDGFWEFSVLIDLYEPLVSYAANGEIVPGAADKWEVSDDGKTYTFHLRENAKWSDGAPVTAGDFVYSFQRAVDPATAAPYASTLSLIGNASAIIEGKEKDLSKLGVTASDDKTLVIQLTDSAPYFIGQLRGTVFMPVRKDIVEKAGAEWTKPGNVVSNGAFMMSEWVPNGSITVVKNPNYWDAGAVKADKVVYYPTEDQAEEFKRFRAGELDISYDVPLEGIATAKAEYPNEYMNDTQIGIYYYTINLAKEPLSSDLKLRQALSMAINREVVTEKITLGGEIPAYGFVPNAPAVMGGYVPAEVDFKSMSMDERLAKAKEIFAAAGYSADKPLKLELRYNTSEAHKKIAIAVASMWKPLGVEVSLVNSETAQHYDSLQNHDFQVGRAGWIADFPDAINFLDILYSKSQNNYASLNDATVDAKIDESKKTADQAARLKLMAEAEKAALELVPVIPIYYYASNHMVSTKVAGWEKNGLDVHLSRYLSVTR